jgi:hypothetical protein
MGQKYSQKLIIFCLLVLCTGLNIFLWGLWIRYNGKKNKRSKQIKKN